MASWSTGQLFQNGNTVATYGCWGGAVRAFDVVTCGPEGGTSAVQIVGDAVQPNGSHHVTVQVLGSGAASFRIVGLNV